MLLCQMLEKVHFPSWFSSHTSSSVCLSLKEKHCKSSESAAEDFSASTKHHRISNISRSCVLACQTTIRESLP